MTVRDGSLSEALTVIQRGTEEIFPEQELQDKLKVSMDTGRPLRVKLGVDPTGADLHLGHIIPILKMKQFQDLGHHCILIIGDYTATVGDPTGKNKTRPQLLHEEVMENARTYQDQVFKILDPEKTEVVYNGDWFGRMQFQDVIRLMSQMTVARMLEREDFSNRFKGNTPIRVHEFMYPLMQGWDSVEIEADVELGGIDQKFNILVGRDLQKNRGMDPQVGVCNPILIGTDGREKMSKSLGNYIGLDDRPEHMYGKVMSIPDDLMIPYFELITEVPLSEISEIRDALNKGSVHPRDVKKRLAWTIVSRFHDEAAASAGEAHFEQVFTQKEVPDDIPKITVPVGELDDDGSIWIVKLIVVAGFASSNGEARRLVKQGGVRLEGKIVDDPMHQWVVQNGAVLQVGKRRFAEFHIGS